MDIGVAVIFLDLIFTVPPVQFKSGDNTSLGPIVVGVLSVVTTAVIGIITAVTAMRKVNMTHQLEMRKLKVEIDGQRQKDREAHNEDLIRMRDRWKEEAEEAWERITMLERQVLEGKERELEQIHRIEDQAREIRDLNERLERLEAKS